jgi:hypothetical protein
MLAKYCTTTLYGDNTMVKPRSVQTTTASLDANHMSILLQMRWEDGAKMTEEHFRRVQSKREQFQSFIQQVFRPNSFMVTPFKYGEPDARDVFRPA